MHFVCITIPKKNSGRDTVVSVCEVDHPTAWVGSVREDMSFQGAKLLNKRSQDYEKEYRLNGAIYVASLDYVCEEKSLFSKRLKAAVMPRERSIDIDEEIDFKLCEALVSG